MSDPHAHGDSSKGIDPVAASIAFLGFAVFVVFFYFNQDLINGVLYIVYFFQLVCIIAITFMLYKLWYLMKLFAKTGGEIVSNYESKLKHHHDHVDKNVSLNSKYALSMQYLHSENKSEWQIGIIELDNFIRMALSNLGYNGETTLELLADAKEKGLRHIKEVEDIAYICKRLKSQSATLDFNKDELSIIVKNFEKFKNIVLPSEHESHDHSTHHEHH